MYLTVCYWIRYALLGCFYWKKKLRCLSWLVIVSCLFMSGEYDLYSALCHCVMFMNCASSISANSSFPPVIFRCVGRAIAFQNRLQKSELNHICWSQWVCVCVKDEISLVSSQCWAVGDVSQLKSMSVFPLSPTGLDVLLITVFRFYSCSQYSNSWVNIQHFIWECFILNFKLNTSWRQSFSFTF